MDHTGNFHCCRNACAGNHCSNTETSVSPVDQCPQHAPCISPQLPCLFSFCKVDKNTGIGLPGAVLELKSPDGAVMTSVSDDTGLVHFYLLPCIHYELTEITPPAGYQPIGASFQIYVDHCGRLFVNNQHACHFVLCNERTYAFAFYKVIADTIAGLAGATFELSSHGAVIASASSNSAGLVDFGQIAPGTYQLKEITQPAGYLLNPNVYTVVIYADGVITVNGLPLENFVFTNETVPVSETPTINAVFVGDATITGMGAPLCTVTVIFADGAQQAATVMPDRTWGVAVPAGTTLIAGQQVEAVQTCPGALPSNPVFTLIETRFVSVYYHANGGMGSDTDMNIPQYATYMIKTAAGTGISRPDYTFTGWNTRADGSGTAYLPNQQITVTHSLTLYAQWEAI